MRLLCTCIALFTLACQGASTSGPAGPASDVSKAPPPPESSAKPPAIAGSPHAPGGPRATATTRAPVNPQPITPSGQLRPETIEGLAAQVPGEWTRKPGSNPMRLAEFTMPGPGGEVTLVVSRFAGGGGDAASNVNRWKTQFTRPDGGPVELANERTSVRGSLTVTTVDIVGTNIASVTPGSPERYHKPDSRLLGAIVEGAGDPFFFKVVGPAKTLDVWEPAFRSFADSIAPG